MGQIKIKKLQTIEMNYLPCIKCGSDIIDFNDCGYSSFNVAWGRCAKCKHEVKISPCSWNISKEDIIIHWNNENDPKILREKYQKQIDDMIKMIEALPS